MILEEFRKKNQVNRSLDGEVIVVMGLGASLIPKKKLIRCMTCSWPILLCDRVGSASGPVGPATMPLVHKGPNPFVLIGEQTKQAGQQLGFCPLPQRHGWVARARASGGSGHRSRIREHGEREEGEGVLFW